MVFLLMFQALGQSGFPAFVVAVALRFPVMFVNDSFGLVSV